MAVDVIIDPSNGQIYWNDNQVTAQSIAISGNASDKINFVGYSGAFAGISGTAPADPVTRVTVSDSATGTLVPGTNGYELGTDALRWAVSATTISTSGTVTITGGPSNINDLLSITNGGTIKVEGNLGGQRGIRLTLRGSGNSTVDPNILSIGNAAGDLTVLNVSADGTAGYGMTLNSSSSGYPLSLKYPQDSTTNTVKETMSVERTTSGTAANGIGSSIIFKTENDAGNLVRNLALEGILASVVGASYRGAFVFKTNGSGSEVLTEKVRISYDNILLSPYDSAGTYELRFNALTGSTYVGFKAPSTIGTNVMWTLPSADGTSNQVLTTNGSGTLTWSTVSSLQALTANNGVMGHKLETGTISSSTASTAVTGTGTSFTTELAENDVIYNLSGLKIGTVSSITNDTNLTLTANAEITHSGNYRSTATYDGTSAVTFGLDVSYAPTWTAKHTYLSSATADSGISVSSTTLSSGRLIDLTINSNASLGNNTGIYISTAGANAITSAFTYGMQIFNTHTGTSAVNFGMAIYTSGAASNIPIRLGLNATYYTNIFVDSKGKFTLSPSGGTGGDSTPIIALQSTGTKTHEFRFLALSGGAGAAYVGFKAPDTVTSRTYILPSADGTADTTSFLATNGAGILSFPSSVSLDTATGTLSATNLRSTNSQTNEGGEIQLALPSSGSTLSGSLTIDLRQNLFRIFETTGDNRGAYIDLTACANGVGTNLLTGSTGGSGTVNSGADGKLAYYAGAGTTVDDASALTYATSGTNLSITASGAAVTPLTLNGVASQSAALFSVKTSTPTTVFEINSSGNISTGTWNGTAITPTYGGTGLTSLGSPNYVLGVNSAGNASEYKNLEAGSNITISHTTGTITIASTGGGTPAGTNNGDIQYKSGSSFAASVNFNYNATNNELRVLNYAPTHSSSTAALKILNGTTWAGSSDGTYIAVNSPTSFSGNLIDLQVNAGSMFKVNVQGAVTIAGNYTLPTIAPLEGQSLYYDGTNLIWEALSNPGTASTNSGSLGSLAYYSGTTTVDDALTLVYSDTGTNLTITASAIGVIPLAVTGVAGQTASIFKAILNTTDVFVINNAGNISTGTWNASTIGVAYGGTGQTSFTNGQLLIGNTTGNTLTKATLTAGSGVDIANGAGSITIRQKRPLYLTFCAGFTPVASGVDSVVLRIPDSPADGSTSVTYNVRELFVRVETASAGTTSVHVQYYTGTSAFSSSGNLMTTALSITGGSTYEASTTTFSQTTLSSGNKVRLNFTALDSTHTNFFIQLLLEEN